MPRSSPHLFGRNRSSSSEKKPDDEIQQSPPLATEQTRGSGVGGFINTVVTPIRETYSQVTGQIEVKKEPVARKFRHFNDHPQYYTHAFSHKTNDWAPVSYQTLNKKFKGHQLRTLRVLTYNIWFHEDENFDARCDTIIKILKESRADIIGLQEVTPKFVRKLVVCDWVQDNYYVTDTTGNSFCGYGNIILTLLRPSCFYTKPLESAMGRQLVMGEFILANNVTKTLEILRVGVVHMESLMKSRSQQMRKDQFRQIFPILTNPAPGYKYVHSILMGDFNLDPESIEETEAVRAGLGYDFLDCWTACHSGDCGNTRFVNYPEEGRDPVRYDRILLSSKKNRFKPLQINTFGENAIDMVSGNDSYDMVFPSDHLGLVCDFNIDFKTKDRREPSPASRESLATS